MKEWKDQLTPIDIMLAMLQREKLLAKEVSKAVGGVTHGEGGIFLMQLHMT